MLVVLAVTSATLYLAENNLRANQQKNLDTQFQNQLRSFLAVQDMQASAITERCRALSQDGTERDGGRTTILTAPIPFCGAGLGRLDAVFEGAERAPR